MRTICTIGMLCFFCTRMFAQHDACDIIGLWITDKEQGIVDIYEKNGKYYGRIIWLKHSHDASGCPVLDSKNQDKALRNRELLGIHVLESFIYDKEHQEWSKGKVYGPNRGIVAAGLITFIDKNTLKVLGYLGVKSLGKSEVWRRTSKRAL
jgi:uncharacterized protein (DUF2147 family)